VIPPPVQPDADKERRFAITDAEQRPGFPTAVALAKRPSRVAKEPQLPRQVRSKAGASERGAKYLERQPLMSSPNDHKMKKREAARRR
jgi:hypothetical protein